MATSVFGNELDKFVVVEQEARLNINIGIARDIAACMRLSAPLYALSNGRDRRAPEQDSLFGLVLIMTSMFLVGCIYC